MKIDIGLARNIKSKNTVLLLTFVHMEKNCYYLRFSIFYFSRKLQSPYKNLDIAKNLLTKFSVFMIQIYSSNFYKDWILISNDEFAFIFIYLFIYLRYSLYFIYQKDSPIPKILPFLLPC